MCVKIHPDQIPVVFLDGRKEPDFHFQTPRDPTAKDCHLAQANEIVTEVIIKQVSAPRFKLGWLVKNGKPNQAPG
jgi:hypothetical protein